LALGILESQNSLEKPSKFFAFSPFRLSFRDFFFQELPTTKFLLGTPIETETELDE
jgi:hypothetical protein